MISFERQAVIKTIGGIEFSIYPLGAMTGRKVLTRLIRMAGPAMGKDTSLADLFAGIKEEDIEYLCDIFAQVTMVTLSPEKKPDLKAVFDNVFAGRYEVMVEWLKACLEVNFSSFFQNLGNALGKSVSKETEKSA